MGLSIRFTGDGTPDTFTLASAGGWAAFAEWAARLGGASAVKRLASGGRVKGTDALAKQLAAALRVSPPPKPVGHTARDLLANLGVGDKGETASVVNEAGGGEP